MRPAAVVLILCAGLLAACSGATLPFSKATDAPPARSPPAIFVATITGLPAGQETAVFEALAGAAADRGIPLGSGKVEDEFALAGEFEEFASSAGREVRYRWTLTDETGRVLHRIEETEAVTGPSGDVPVTRIAAYTAENLSSRLSQLGYATRAAGMPPPLDHLAQAGPGAEQEIDYETLHGPGGPPASDAWAGDQAATPEQAPAESEPKAAGADQSIQGVAITRVEGAGATGNAELSAALARVLTDAGWPVMQRPGSNVLAIEGDVTLSQPAGEAQKVALRWTVKAPNGDILGAVEQANDVPAGSLDETWGKAADHAALAAAQGIFDLVDKLR
jgi:hypothetical protein